MILKYWKLNSLACKIKPADRSLGGLAPLEAMKYCGPFMHANQAGFHIYSPIDMDVSYNPNYDPTWNYQLYSEDFLDSEDRPLKAYFTNNPEIENYLPRTKLFFSKSTDQPQHTLQIWTGCIFKTPPGWSLLLRCPINREYSQPFRIEDAIIESDWFTYDIYLNLKFHEYNKVAKLRREGAPLAHIIPIKKESYEPSWRIQEQALDINDKETQKTLAFWQSFNSKKFASKSEKNKSTYHIFRKSNKQ